MLVILYKATESQIIPVMLPGKKGTYRTKVVKVLYSMLRAWTGGMTECCN